MYSFNHLITNHIITVYQHYIIFQIVILTKTCKILQYCYQDNVCLLWANLLQCILKKIWCQLPEDGEMIAPKHVGALHKIVRVD